MNICAIMRSHFTQLCHVQTSLPRVPVWNIPAKFWTGCDSIKSSLTTLCLCCCFVFWVDVGPSRPTTWPTKQPTDQANRQPTNHCMWCHLLSNDHAYLLMHWRCVAPAMWWPVLCDDLLSSGAWIFTRPWGATSRNYVMFRHHCLTFLNEPYQPNFEMLVSPSRFHWRNSGFVVVLCSEWTLGLPDQQRNQPNKQMHKQTDNQPAIACRVTCFVMLTKQVSTHWHCVAPAM